MSLALEGLGNAPKLRDLFVATEGNYDQPSAFQRAMQFAKGASRQQLNELFRNTAKIN